MNTQIKHFRDGQVRDKSGRWSGKMVTVRKEHYDQIQELQQKTGMTKAQFWREAVMQGAVLIAKSRGIEFEFSALDNLNDTRTVVVVNSSKRNFPTWLFRSRVTSNGLRYLRWGLRTAKPSDEEKAGCAGKGWGFVQNPQRQVHAMLDVLVIGITILIIASK